MKIHFILLCGYLVFPFLLKRLPHCIVLTLMENRLIMYTVICFWALYPIPLVYLSVFMPVSYYGNYYSCVISSKFKKCEPSILVHLFQYYFYCTDLWKAETSLESHSLEIYVVNKIFLLRVTDKNSKTSKISWSCVWRKWSVFTEWSVAAKWFTHWFWRWLSPLLERVLNTQDSDATSWSVYPPMASTLAGFPRTQHSKSPAYRSASCELLKVCLCILMFIHVC